MHDAAVTPSDYTQFVQPSSGTNCFHADRYDPNAYLQLAIDASAVSIK